MKVPVGPIEPRSGLVTVMVRASAVAPGVTVTLNVKVVPPAPEVVLVEVGTTVTPGPLKVTVAPVTRFVPVIVTDCEIAPWDRLVGATDV